MLFLFAAKYSYTDPADSLKIKSKIITEEIDEADPEKAAAKARAIRDKCLQTYRNDKNFTFAGELIAIRKAWRTEWIVDKDRGVGKFFEEKT